MSRACPACLAENAATVAEALASGSFYRCGRCGLQYVEPVPTGVPVFLDFTDAGRIILSQIERGEPIGELLTPNERAMLRWLQRHLPEGAPVLELCCESGRFLAALRRAGFSPLGMDPLPRPIEMLKEQGFSVHTGSVEDYPKDWPEPAAVVLLESLVRFPFPVTVLRSIRERFPRARLCLSVPSPRRSLKVPDFDRRVDYPPHHLTRWTPRSMVTALRNAGYRGGCRVAHIRLHWMRGAWTLRILKVLFAIYLRLTREADYSLLGYGTPA